MISFEAKIRKGNKAGVLEITIPRDKANKEGLLEGDEVLVWIKPKEPDKEILESWGFKE